jgi:hypothetical protein
MEGQVRCRWIVPPVDARLAATVTAGIWPASITIRELHSLAG